MPKAIIIGALYVRYVGNFATKRSKFQNILFKGLKNIEKCDVFVFFDSFQNIIGTLSVMYRGGNDIEYKIRNIEAFIYNVFTDEQYRGKGYAKQMINLLMLFLHKKVNY